MGAPSITLSPGGGFLLEPTGSVTIFTPEMLSDEQRMMRDTADDFPIKLQLESNGCSVVKARSARVELGELLLEGIHLC